MSFDILITVFVILMTVLAFSQGSRLRLPCLIISFCHIVHEIIYMIEIFFNFQISGIIYYLIIALLDFITIVLISNKCALTKLAINLQRISLISLLLNLSAWTCFINNVKHANIYNFSYVVLYMLIIIIMTMKDKHKNGDLRDDLWASYFRFDHN